MIRLIPMFVLALGLMGCDNKPDKATIPTKFDAPPTKEPVGAGAGPGGQPAEINQ